MRFTDPLARLISIAFLAIPLSASAQEIAITLDDLPYIPASRTSPAEGLQIVQSVTKALRFHNITATGFVIGQQLKRKTIPALQAFAEAGHTIGNHSWSHPDYGTLHRSLLPLPLPQRRRNRSHQGRRHRSAHQPRLPKHPRQHRHRRLALQSRLLGCAQSREQHQSRPNRDRLPNPYARANRPFPSPRPNRTGPRRQAHPAAAHEPHQRRPSRDAIGLVRRPRLALHHRRSSYARPALLCPRHLRRAPRPLPNRAHNGPQKPIKLASHIPVDLNHIAIGVMHIKLMHPRHGINTRIRNQHT